jgi:hypothetical protein
MIADFSAAGDQVGCRAFSSAMMPATCGAAIDVPDVNSLEPLFAAKMLAPGAAMSGCGGIKDCNEITILYDKLLSATFYSGYLDEISIVG